MKLQKELKQNKPFKSLEEEVVLNVARTAEYMAAAKADVFKLANLTATQYNVLRILRGAGQTGISCSDISDRMITRESDITRLLDRIENMGLITRERPASNRRMVISRITDDGLQVLTELDGPVDELNQKLVGHLSEQNLKTAINILEEMRTTV